MTTSLEDILNNSVTPKATTAPAPEQEQPAPPEPEADLPSQEAAPTGEQEPTPSAAPPAAPVEEPLDKKISAFQRKAEDETRKRQDYERKLQQAEAAIAERDRYIEAERQRLQQLAAQRQDEIDLYDPNQAKHYVNQIVAENLLVQKVITSQELMRDRHEDYDEVEAIFAEEMERDPSLQQKMWADPMPAKFAYTQGKKFKAMREIGDDPAAFKERIKQELLAEIQGQQPAAPAAAPPVQTLARPVPQPPKTLAGVPSASRDPVKHPWKGPTPLDQLLN